MDIDKLNSLLNDKKKREDSSAKKRVFAQYYDNQVKALGDSEKTFIESQNNYMDNWNDDAGLEAHQTKSTKYYNQANSFRNTLLKNANIYRELLGQEAFSKVYNTVGDILKNKDNADKYITSQSELYKKYQNADEYNKAKKQAGFNRKYSKIKTFEDYQKNANTKGEVLEKLPKDEQDYLKQLGFYLEYSELHTALNGMKERKANLEKNLSTPQGYRNSSNWAQSQRDLNLLNTNIKNAEIRLSELNSMGGVYAGIVNQILANNGEIAFDQRWAGTKKAYEDYKKDSAKKSNIDKLSQLGEYYEPSPDEMTPQERNKALSGQKVLRKREETTNENTLEIDPIFDDSRFNGEGVSEILEYYATPEEKELHAFLKKTKGEGVARKYLEELKTAKLDKRLNQAIFDAEYEYGSKNPLTASVTSVVYNLLSVVEMLGQINNPYYQNHRSIYATKAQGQREGVKSQIDSDVWDFIYDAGMSGIDSAVAGFISGGSPLLSEFILGSSAAASSYNDALDRGVSGADALNTAMISGVAEGVFEHFSLEKMFDTSDITKGFTKAGLKQAAKKVATDMFVNFSEESLTEISNVVADQMINGELSNYATSVRNYMSQGLSEEEAKKKAASDVAIQIGEAGLSGMLMGAGFGMVGSVKGMKNSQMLNSRSGSIIKQNGSLADLKDFAANSGVAEIQKAAEKLTPTSKASKIGSVYNSLIENAVDNSVKQMTPILLKNGATKSGSNSAEGWARQIATSVLDNTSNDRHLYTNNVTKNVYTEFTENGKYGSNELIALRDMTDTENRSNKFGPGYVTQEGNIINEQGIEVPMTDYGMPAIGPVTEGSINSLPPKNSSGQIKNLADVYGESVANRLEAERPSPKAKTEADIQAEKQAYFDKYFAMEKQITPEEEEHLKEFGESKGLEVEFVDGAVNDIGYGVFENGKKIVISRYAKKPMRILFKHEFTHSVENAKGYKSFQEYVLKESEAFKEWLATKGFEDDSAAIKDMMERYKGKVDYNKVDTDSTDKKDNNYEKAKADVIADFVGEVLFGDNVDKNKKPIKIDTNFLVELKRKDRNLFYRFVDWVNSIIQRLKASGVVNKDIIRLEQKFKRLAEQSVKERERTEGKQNQSGKTDGQYSLPDKYWYPNMSVKELNTVRQKAKYELNTTENYLDNDTKWLYNDKNGKKYFALYGTSDESDPTILYACKGARAERENRLLSEYFEVEVSNNGSLHTKAEIINRILKDSRSETGNRIADSRIVVGESSNRGNASVYSKKSRRGFSEALLNCLRNIQKVSEQGNAGGRINQNQADSIDEPAYSLPNGNYNIPDIDANYLKAVESGDMETAQRMADEVAKENGYTRKMFHETDAENIHIFDTSLGTHGATDSETPYGIFTKSSDKNIGLGNIQMSLYVKADNTLYVENREEVKAKIPELIPYYDEIARIDKEYESLAEEFENAEFDALSEWMDENPDADMDVVYPTQYIIDKKPAAIDSQKYLDAFSKRERIMEEWSEEYNKVAIKCKEFITSYLRNNGYDSMYFKIDAGSRGRQTDSLILLDSNQVKSANPVTYDDDGNVIPLSQRFNPENEDIRYSLPDDGYAPTFYSKMGKTIDAMKQDKIGANSVVSYLKGRGVKDEEIKWSGIATFLEGKKSVTKAELQEFIAGSQLQIEEKVLDGKKKAYPGNLELKKNGWGKLALTEDGKTVNTYHKASGSWIADVKPYSVFDNKEDIIASAKRKITNPTHWENYTLDGGENYREVLFKMPNSTYTNTAMKAHWGKGILGEDNSKGVLAHARLQDFDVDGKKMLFIEEIQSDWHNEGHKEGYDVVPDAPFKDNYHEFVLKNLIRNAAENGYDSIGWTPADIQSERWSDEFAEGYRIEYDQDMPKFLKKYGKQWGATVGSTVLNNGTEVWSMDITDQMKNSVLYEGQALYSLPNDSYNVPEIARGKSNEELNRLIEEGKITTDDAFNSLRAEHGTMPKGESPKVDVTVPNKVSEKQGVRRFPRTALESGHLTDGMSKEAKREILDGALNYKILSNNRLVNMAEHEVKNDINKAIKKWEDLVESGRMPTAREIVLGEVLMVEAAKAGNANDVAMYLAELSAMGTELGQGIQALSLLKKLSGVGQLHYVSRVIAQLNEDLKSRYGDKYLDKMVKLNPYQEKMLAESKDESEIESIIDDILTDVARQLPSTWRDKANAWRYLAMLGNVKTHFRNFLGNGVFMPAIRLKNTLASVAEKIVIRDEANRTKSFKLKKEYKDFAEADFKNVEDLISKGGKMSPSSIVDERRKIFTSKAFGWLENARQFNFNMLEKEDMYFLKRHYKVALASVLQSRGINLNNVTDEQLQSARNYAIKEAQKATYRDFSYFANMLNKLANPNKNGNGWDALRAVGGVLVEGAVPFKKTPINVLKRGVEYSPIGIATSLVNAAIAAKRGEYSGAQLIDGLSAGMSGTMILGLGMFLQSIGWITGGLGYDDDDALERMSGAQPYSLNFGEVINDLAGVVGIDADVDNYSLTIDWMAPSSLPLLIGAEIQKANEEAENFNFFDALATIGEPMTELSFLQGISDVIDGIAYSGEDSLGTMGEVATNLASSYLSQYIPTLSGQTARTLDESRRTNFIDKESIVPKSIQKVWQKTLGKIPFAANEKVPYIDAWGKVDKEDNVALRAFENFLSPTYISKIEDDKVNKELAKVYADTKDSGIIPKRASTSFAVNGVTKNLTPEEYVKYATNRGQYSRQYVENVMGNSMYKGLSSENKAEAISFLLSFANAKAKSDVSDYDYTSVSTYKSAAKFEMAGIDVTSYAIAKAAMRKENADTDGSGSVDKDERKEALEKAGFTRRERNKFLDIYYSNYEDILDDYGE